MSLKEYKADKDRVRNIIKLHLSAERIELTASFVFHWLNSRSVLVLPFGVDGHKFFVKHFKKFPAKIKKLSLISYLISNPRLEELIRDGGRFSLYIGFKPKGRKWVPVFCMTNKAGQYVELYKPLNKLSMTPIPLDYDTKNIIDDNDHALIMKKIKKIK